MEKKEYFGIFFSKFVCRNEGLFDIIKRLKNLKLFVLSNNNPPFYEHVMKSNYEIFDKVLISYQVRMKKPNPLFFQKVLENTNIKPQECVFVDDREDLVDATKRFGMKAIAYISVKNFQDELSEFGVKIWRTMNPVFAEEFFLLYPQP